jgi:hypothetical protein
MHDVSDKVNVQRTASGFGYLVVAARKSGSAPSPAPVAVPRPA